MELYAPSHEVMGWGVLFSALYKTQNNRPFPTVFSRKERENMIKVTLKDGTVKEFEAGISAADAAKDISMGLYRAACAAKINGEANYENP